MHIRISMFFKFTNSNQQFLQLKNAADIGLPDAGLPEVGLEVGLPNVENLLRSKNGKMEKNTNYQLLPQYHAWTPELNEPAEQNMCTLTIANYGSLSKTNDLRPADWKFLPIAMKHAGIDKIGACSQQLSITKFLSYDILEFCIPMCRTGAEPYPEYPTWPPS